MTCKDCIHYKVCSVKSKMHTTFQFENGKRVNTDFLENIENKCKRFLDNSKYIELPCKVGDTVYVIPSKVNYELNKINGHCDNNKVYVQTVDEVRIYRNGDYLLTTCDGMNCVHKQFYRNDWFLTNEEAEKALKEREKE